MSRLTAEERGEIAARWEKATPGPWVCYNGWGPVEGSPFYAMTCIGKPDGTRVVSATSPREPTGSRDFYARELDAEAIASAPEDVRRLLVSERAGWEEADRLRAAAQPIVDAHGYGSKAGRPDYVDLIPCDKTEALRDALGHGR